MCAGWAVAKPETRESYDIVARDPVSAEWKTFQVKTILLRADRRNEMVVYARKGNGKPYSQPEADYIIGILGGKPEADGKPAVTPRAWMFPNRGISEYWATETTAADRWFELPLGIQREFYTVNTAAGDVTYAS